MTSQERTRFFEIYDDVMFDRIRYNYQLQEFLDLARKISKINLANTIIYFENMVVSDALFIEAFNDVLDHRKIKEMLSGWKQDVEQYGFVPDLFPRRVLEIEKGLTKEHLPEQLRKKYFAQAKKNYRRLDIIVKAVLSDKFLEIPEQHRVKPILTIIEFDIYGRYAEVLDTILERHPELVNDIISEGEGLNFSEFSTNVLKPIIKHLFLNREQIDYSTFDFCFDYELDPSLLYFILLNNYYTDDPVDAIDAVTKRFELGIYKFMCFTIINSFLEKSGQFKESISKAKSVSRINNIPHSARSIKRLDVNNCERFTSPGTCYYTDKLVRLALGEGLGLNITDLVLATFFLLERKVDTTVYSTSKLCDIVKMNTITQGWFDKQLDYVRSLNNLDKELLSWYSFRGDRVINMLLRTRDEDAIKAYIANTRISHMLLEAVPDDQLISKIEELSKRLLAVIANAPPLDRDLVVFRGFKEAFSSSAFKDEGFSSVSAAFKVAQGFAEEETFMSIHLPKGFRCLLMMRYSFYPEEMEILLPSGTTFSVTNEDELFVADGDCLPEEDRVAFKRVYDVRVSQ